MRLFIDSANIDDIKEVAGWGIISGVTTNPSLISKEGKDLKYLVNQIYKIIDGPIFIESVGLRTGDIIREGREYASLHPNIIISIPMTEKGLEASKILNSDGIATNISLVFSANQALLAALAGASFVSPAISKIDETGSEGIALISEIRTIFDHYVFSTQIITSDIISTQQVSQAAKLGSDMATIPHNILKQMFKHPLTDTYFKQYINDHQSIPTYKVPQGV